MHSATLTVVCMVVGAVGVVVGVVLMVAIVRAVRAVGGPVYPPGVYMRCNTGACRYTVPGTGPGVRWRVVHPVVHRVRLHRHRKGLRGA